MNLMAKNYLKFNGFLKIEFKLLAKLLVQINLIEHVFCDLEKWTRVAGTN